MKNKLKLKQEKGNEEQKINETDIGKTTKKKSMKF